jgi:hypothetical protein
VRAQGQPPSAVEVVLLTRAELETEPPDEVADEAAVPPEELERARIIREYGEVELFEGRTDGRWRILIIQVKALTVLDAETLERLARFRIDFAVVKQIDLVEMDIGTSALAMKDPAHSGRVRFICLETAQEWEVDFDDGEVGIPGVSFVATGAGGQGGRIVFRVTRQDGEVVSRSTDWIS